MARRSTLRERGFIYSPTPRSAGMAAFGRRLGGRMTAIGTSGSAGRPDAVDGPARSSGAEAVPAVLWIPDDDVRLLLRGLLTLHHHPVVLELPSSEALRRWDAPPVALLIVDAVSGGERWREELSDALRVRPELRAIVLLPRDRQGWRTDAAALGARVTLVRPFAVREFVGAIQEALAGSSVPPSS